MSLHVQYVSLITFSNTKSTTQVHVGVLCMKRWLTLMTDAACSSESSLAQQAMNRVNSKSNDTRYPSLHRDYSKWHKVIRYDSEKTTPSHINHTVRLHINTASSNTKQHTTYMRKHVCYHVLCILSCVSPALRR